MQTYTAETYPSLARGRQSVSLWLPNPGEIALDTVAECVPYTCRGASADFSDDSLHHRAGAAGAAPKPLPAGRRENGGGFDTLPRPLPGPCDAPSCSSEAGQ